MTTRLIYLVLLIVCFSCGTNNKPVSDAQKEKIKGEVKEVIDIIYKGGEEVTAFTEPWLDTPDFVYINNGKSSTYAELMETAKSYFNTLTNQKCTIVEEKYNILDNSTVVYSATNKWKANFKDGHSILSDPWAWIIIIKKTDNKWKAIYFAESGVKQNIKNSKTSKELNQVELFKQFLGSWKCDWAKDTTAFYEGKSYGTGLDCYFKFITKGKVVIEGRQLRGYDTNNDKFVISTMLKGTDINVDAAWFISKNKFQFIPYNYIASTYTPSRIIEGEFKSPDLILKITYINNKPVKTETWTRIK
jgi:hypothetical protein